MEEEGKSRDAIWQETGWTKGKDGRMRYKTVRIGDKMNKQELLLWEYTGNGMDCHSEVFKNWIANSVKLDHYHNAKHPNRFCIIKPMPDTYNKACILRNTPRTEEPDSTAVVDKYPPEPTPPFPIIPPIPPILPEQQKNL